MQIELSRKWFLVVVGLADWRAKAQELPHQEYKELQEVIDNYISRTNKDFRKKGGLVTSLFWSQENLSPTFLLEATRTNEDFLKGVRVKQGNVTENIYASLSSDERNSSLGKNLQTVSPQGRILILECTIPQSNDFIPDDDHVLSAFNDAFNSEFVTIKRAELDFQGRKEWLATLDALLTREIIREVGPVKKLKEAKVVEGKRLYDRKTPGDFEKITRILHGAVPFRPSLFDLKPLPQSSFDTREALGHIVIQYLSTGGDFPIKLNWRSNTHERLGRRTEEVQLVEFEGVEWKDIDKLLLISREIVYDKIEKTISNIGGIKFDSFWTERDLSSNIFFFSKFSFTEDILKAIKEFLSLDSRKQLEGHIGPSTTALFDVWRRAGLHFNILVFEIRGFDTEEDKKLATWVQQLKEKSPPGPNYNGEKEVLEARHYRPF
ncbi:MAG: hypothetical protein ACTSQ0_06345 [Candidatus Heimdallarchaeota archaeon]